MANDRKEADENDTIGRAAEQDVTNTADEEFEDDDDDEEKEGDAPESI